MQNLRIKNAIDWTHEVKSHIAVFWLVLFLAILTGCSTFTRYKIPSLPENAIKPVVAVTDFENETGFSGQWKLGSGIPDMLVSELLATDRVIVVDRQKLGVVIGEIMHQGKDLFRKEGSVERGRLKHAQYLIRGVITDFTQTRSASGWFRTHSVGIGGRGAKAIVMIHLTVTDVETGEIICSIPADGSARASSQWAKFDYSNTAFGGDMFFKSPIGRATQQALRKAVYEIIQEIPFSLWKPRIAEAIPDIVVINGGENTGVNIGDIFDVHAKSQTVTDPETGNVIDLIPGKIIGKIRITTVHSTSAEGIILSGKAKRGNYLEKIKRSSQEN
jgi:curli biogenesis system outer membrane secretion channel CsgG